MMSPFEAINLAVGLQAGAVQFVVQLPRTLLEVGLAGLACLFWLYWQAWRVGRQAARSSEQDPWLRAQALAFEAIWLLYVVLAVFYQDVWRVDQTSFAFWLWAAVLAGAGARPPIDSAPDARRDSLNGPAGPPPAHRPDAGRLLGSSGGALQ
jgi:hypothetical protein